MIRNHITVALLTYNRSKTVVQSIKSILNDKNHIQLIIFDDGSDPEQFIFIEQYCAKYPQIKIFKNEKNMGYQNNLIKALNYLSNCDSQIVFLCESDMLLTKNWSDYVFEAFNASRDSVALSAMLHEGQFGEHRSAIFRERCITGCDPRFPHTRGREPFGKECYVKMPDAEKSIKISGTNIRFIANSVGSIIFKKEYLKKIILYLDELKKFPVQEDAWLSYMCFKVNQYHPRSFMVLDPGIAFTFGEKGLHGDMILCNVRWLGSIFWKSSFMAQCSKVFLKKYIQYKNRYWNKNVKKNY